MLKEEEGIEVECDSAKKTAKREREREIERVEEICKGTRGEMESAKRGKMPMITPPSVPSRFQVRARFIWLIRALFLASASRQVSGSTLIQGRLFSFAKHMCV